MLLLWFMGFFTFVVVHGQHQHASNIKVITRSRCFGIVPPHMKLECTDPKHFMRVISAVYGLSSDTACGDLCCPQVNDCQVPVNMSRPETHNQIFGQCSGQQECIVLVEQASLWSAPCGRGKYSNYLQVKYECVKAEITTQSNCYGEPSGTMHLYCEKGTFINIKDAVYGRSNRTPCARRCCPAETDCVEKLLEKTPPLYTAILGQCLGRAECTIPVDKISGMCGNQFHVSTYVNVTYECVPVSIVNEVCMEGNNAIDVGYIQSEGYPAEVPGNNLRSCECRLSTAKNSSITIRAVDINMYSGPGCREHQELAMFTKTDQAAYSCQHITDTILYNGPANELNMKFVNTLFSNEGKFWLEYSASWGTVIVNCTSAISITTTTTLTPPVTQPMVKVDPGSSIRSILIVPDPNTKGGDTGDQSQEEPWRYQSRCFGKSPPHMELTCSEPKTFIKIQAAVYGLNTNDRCNDICCPSNNDCQVHVNASRPESYKQIVDQCSGQTHCIVLVEQGELWTAECGRGKYSNYLMVAYQCVKAKVTTISKCYGEYPPEMNLFCDIGTYIHIRDAIFGRSDYKPCPRRCCPREDDCAEKVRTRNPGLYTAILGQCLGRTQCSIPVERLHGTCGSEFYNSNYMNITYQCVPVSIVNDFCTKEDNMLDQGYIMSEKYPTKIPGNNLRQCKCVLTAPPAATIAVRAIDFSPYNGTRCQDLQTLTFEEQRKPSSSFSCEHRVDFWMYNSTRNQVNVTFLNTLLGNVGQFWLEYTASSGNVTLNCTEPVGVTTPKPGATTIPTTQKVTQPYRYRNPDENNTPRPTDTASDTSRRRQYGGGDTTGQDDFLTSYKVLATNPNYQLQGRCFGKIPPHMELSCPEPKTFIRIISAFYGRSYGSSCGDICCPKESDCQVHVEKSRPESYEQLVEQCSGQSHCVVLVEQGPMWGVKCAFGGGYSNYMHVVYECVKVLKTTVSMCHGVLPGHITLFCDVGTHIRIHDAIYGRAPDLSCPHRCCPRDTDCTVPLAVRTPGVYRNMVGDCLGNRECNVPVNRVQGMCGSQFLSSNYVNITYECIPVSITNTMCEEGDRILDDGHILSENYPRSVLGNDFRKCTCAITAEPNNGVSISAIELHMYDELGCEHQQQLIVNSHSRSTSVYSCDKRSNVMMYEVAGGQVNITFVNTVQKDAGRFWLHYKARNGPVTVNCTSSIPVTTTTTSATTPTTTTIPTTTTTTTTTPATTTTTTRTTTVKLTTTPPPTTTTTTTSTTTIRSTTRRTTTTTSSTTLTTPSTTTTKMRTFDASSTPYPVSPSQRPNVYKSDDMITPRTTTDVQPTNTVEIGIILNEINEAVSINVSEHSTTTQATFIEDPNINMGIVLGGLAVLVLIVGIIVGICLKAKNHREQRDRHRSLRASAQRGQRDSVSSTYSNSNKVNYSNPIQHHGSNTMPLPGKSHHLQEKPMGRYKYNQGRNGGPPSRTQSSNSMNRPRSINSSQNIRGYKNPAFR